MAIINKVDNTASIIYGGNTITSNTVSTILLLAPTIVKSVDKLTANIGDVLNYTITISNLSLSAVTNLAFSDTIGLGSTYVANSFTLNSTAVTPTITGSTLTYTIPTVPALGTALIQYQVTVVGGSSI